MRSALAAGGTGITAALCCLAIPITVDITGLSDLGALGANIAVAAIAGALVVSIVRSRPS